MSYWDEVITCIKCGNSTTCGKPYCTKHVKLMPQASKIIDRDSKLQKHIKETMEHGTFIFSSPITDEIVSYLKINGEYSIALISKRVCLPVKVVDIYVRKLARRKILKIRRYRNRTLVRIRV